MLIREQWKKVDVIKERNASAQGRRFRLEGLVLAGLALLALFMLTSGPLDAEEPAPSPNALMRFATACGDTVVFSARSQLWSVPLLGGTATPLTSGPGQKMTARCSPDHRWVEYLRDAAGSRDVYVIPTRGGTPKRLTFRPTTTNAVVSWTPDSTSVVFLSSHEDWVGQRSRAFAVSLTGGEPVPLGLDQAGDLTFNADGHQFVYTRFLTDFKSWKRYEGGEAPKLFLYYATHINNGS